MKIVAKILSKDVSDQVKYIKTGFEGFKDLKIWKLENFFSQKVTFMSESISKAKTTSYVWSLIPRSLIEASVFITIGIFLIIVSDFDLLSNNSIVVVTFFLALLKVLPSFQQTYYSWQSLRSGIEVGDETRKYLELEHANNEECVSPESFKSLSIKNLDFSFKNNLKVFNNFSLEISRGDKVAIYGNSGVGKSTLLNLISGFYIPQKGEILFNDQVISENQINPLISYISQDPFLFDLTIKDNITLSFAKKEKIDEKKLKIALFESGVQKYIEENNLSLDYVIGESGSNLSGGQAQRIAIARALYSGKELILLDEAASALDSLTKDFVIKNLLKLKETIVLITHDKEIYDSFPITINLNEIGK